MKKVFLRFWFVALIIFIIATLPMLYIVINGAIIGSFEMFPRPEDVEAKRCVYIILTMIITILDIFAIIGVIKLFKTIGSK